MSAPTSDDGLKIARQIKDLIRNHTPTLPVRRVLLFGSVARGEARDHSDIDIAVICEPFDRSKVKEARQIYALSPDINAGVEFVILHPDDLQNPFSSIARTVEKEGIEV